MDYDQTTMPENYDRGRKPADGMIQMWMDRLALAINGQIIKSVVDLGCGTGRFTQALADRFDASVVGLDPSEKMLAQARAKPVSDRVKFAKGAGEDIPCADSSADLIFSSMAFHHFRSREQTARECHRVLRQGGVLSIRNSTSEHSSPYEAYFPNYRAALDLLPATSEIMEAFTANGFTMLQHETIPHMMARNVGELAEKAAFRADTTLLRLSNSDFERGLANMRAATSMASAPAMIDIDLFLFVR